MAWLMSGRAVEQLEQTSPQQLAGRLEKSNIRIIDVRTPAEWDQPHQVGRAFPPVRYPRGPISPRQKDEELVLQCGSGYRSNIAASICAGGVSQCQISGRRNLCLVQCGLTRCVELNRPSKLRDATNRTRSWKDQKGKDYRMQSLPFPLGENRRIARVSCKPYEEYANSFTA
jgi:hypothetical protein